MSDRHGHIDNNEHSEKRANVYKGAIPETLAVVCGTRKKLAIANSDQPGFRVHLNHVLLLYAVLSSFGFQYRSLKIGFCSSTVGTIPV
jgi:hypothetical protein